MTICLAIKCKKSEQDQERPVLLFASDTQQSSGYLKRTVTKMRAIYGKEPRKGRIEKWGILVASAGDALVIDEVVPDIERFLRDKIPPDGRDPSVSLKELRKGIGDLAYNTYQKYKKRDIGSPEFKFDRIMYESEARWKLLKKIWWKLQEDNTFKARVKNIL